MPKTLSKLILRGFCDVGIGLAGLVLLVVAFLVFSWTVGLLTWATMTVELPNGAVVARAFDWNLRPRADLYASVGGPLLARGIDMICWDETAIDGYADRIERADRTEYGGHSFFWAKGDEKALPSASPDYLPRWRNSSLPRNAQGACGPSGGYVSGDLLLHDPRSVAGTTWSRPLVRDEIRTGAWAKSPHRHPPRPAEIER